MANQDIRTFAKQNGVKLWQIAKVKGISEPTMTRLLRQELSKEEKATFRRIITELAAREQTAVSE